jgi:serine/threonine-protein kinase
MLAGHKAFEGKTVTDILASIIVREPDLAPLPPKVRPLLQRCLEKDPRKRLRDIADAMALVEETADAPAPAQRSQPRLIWTAAAASILIAAAAVIGRWSAPEPREPVPSRLDVDLGPDVTLAMPFGSIHTILSPDGLSIVYLAGVGGGPPRLYIRRLDQTNSVELPGTEGANSPFFSPDGRWVGFSVADKLYKVALDGGAPILLSAPGVSRGSDWAEDGTVFTSVLLKGLVATPPGGGNVASILGLPDGEDGISAPQVLPDGKALLYSFTPRITVHRESARIEVLSLADRKRKVIAEGGDSPRYLPVSRNSGYLLYTVGTTLFAVPFDLDRMEKRGAPVAVQNDVGSRTFEQMQFDVSATGALIYRKSSGDPAHVLSTIQTVDTAGKAQPLIAKPGAYRSAQLSPDGKRLLVGVGEGTFTATQVYDLARETWIPLPGGARFILATWGPDGQTAILGSISGLFWTRTDGAGQPEPLLAGKEIRVPISISPDGKRLAFNQGIINQTQMWTVPLDNAGGQLHAGTPEPFLKSTSRDMVPEFSPDGKWMAYQSNQSGADEVYVRAFPDNGNLWKISSNGGVYAYWSPRAHDLIYQSRDQVLAVSWSEKDGRFVPEKPRVWASNVSGTVFGFMPDGKRLLVIANTNPITSPQTEHEVVLFQNFTTFLKQHVPAGK